MSRRQKYVLWRIIIAALLFVVSIFLPAEGCLKLLICLVPFLAAGYDIVWEAAGNIFRGNVFDEKFLMSLASLGAFAIGEYHEAVFVMLFFQVGELFESIAVGKSRRSVAALMDIRPDHANVLRDGQLCRIEPDEVAVGELIAIMPGERVPLDGVIEDGFSSLDTAPLTGESMPREVAAGDSVVSGCININGVLRVRVTKPCDESTVSRILDLVEESAANKSRSETFITRFARWYTPTVVACAALLAIVPSFLSGGWSEWLHRALVFLVVSCPCALVISVPLSYFGGIGKASKRGILVKGSNYLDALAACRRFVFDKTGTLTRGSFSVEEVNAANGNNAELLRIAAMAEVYSSHPIAVGIRKAFSKEIDTDGIKDVQEHSGFGISANIEGKAIIAGKAELLMENGIDVPTAEYKGLAVYVASNGVYMGCIVLADSPKPDSAAALAKLKSLGAGETVMLTGDGEIAAGVIGDALGIDKVYSSLLPADKVRILEELLEKEGTLAYVGDGINDAPSLSRADIGIAMGALGSDAAIEAADIVLMDDSLYRLPEAVEIAMKTRRIVAQNIVFALGVKFLVLILGAIGFAGMWAAAMADVGVCVVAILNAMRA